MTLRNVANVYFRVRRQKPKLYRLPYIYMPRRIARAFKLATSLNLRQQEILETMFLRASADHGNMKGRQRAYAVRSLGIIKHVCFAWV